MDAVAGAAEDSVVKLDLRHLLQVALLQPAVYLVLLLAPYAIRPVEIGTWPSQTKCMPAQ